MIKRCAELIRETKEYTEQLGFNAFLKWIKIQ